MRLIDADRYRDLLEKDKNLFKVGSLYYEGLRDGLERARVGLLREADTPTVDAEPVVHAHWERIRRRRGGFRTVNGRDRFGVSHIVRVDERYENDCPRCSKCHCFTEDSSPEYCPHCGAIMDEEV